MSNADFNSGNNNVEWACHDCYHITFPFHSTDHSNLFKLNSFNVKYSLHLVPTDNFKKNCAVCKKNLNLKKVYIVITVTLLCIKNAVH